MASFLLASWGRAREVVLKPGKKNSGRDEKTWDKKTWDEKTQNKKTRDEKTRDEKTREKKHLQARAKTPCYREDSELHHGEGVVNEVFL